MVATSISFFSVHPINSCTLLWYIFQTKYLEQQFIQICPQCHSTDFCTGPCPVLGSQWWLREPWALPSWSSQLSGRRQTVNNLFFSVPSVNISRVPFCFNIQQGHSHASLLPGARDLEAGVGPDSDLLPSCSLCLRSGNCGFICCCSRPGAFICQLPAIVAVLLFLCYFFLMQQQLFIECLNVPDTNIIWLKQVCKVCLIFFSFLIFYCIFFITI